MLDLRKWLLEEAELERRAVPVPEWPALDGRLWVREMTAAERCDYLLAHGAGGKKKKAADSQAWAALLVYCLCDADGHLLFGPEDAEALSGKSGRVLQRLFAAAADLNTPQGDPAKNSAPAESDS